MCVCDVHTKECFNGTPVSHPLFDIICAVCTGAKADLVFLIDGSWSIGDESFNKVIQFVFSMTGAFDVISASGMQVGGRTTPVETDLICVFWCCSQLILIMITCSWLREVWQRSHGFCSR